MEYVINPMKNRSKPEVEIHSAFSSMKCLGVPECYPAMCHRVAKKSELVALRLYNYIFENMCVVGRMFSCVSTFEPKIHQSEVFFLKIEAFKKVIESFYAVSGLT